MNATKYSSVILGKDRDEYVAWILDETSWGGEIELNILAHHYQVEIMAIDVQSLTPLCYGKGPGITKRVFLIYDGIHYDALACGVSEKEWGGDITRVEIGDEESKAHVMEVIRDLREVHDRTRREACRNETIMNVRNDNLRM